MRWIKERAEALLQLRCIDAKGHWQTFTDRVHDDMRRTPSNVEDDSSSSNVSLCRFPRIHRKCNVTRRDLHPSEIG